MIPFQKEIDYLLNQGVMGTVIEQRVRKQGYDGSASTIRHYIIDWKRRRKLNSEDNNVNQIEIIERKDKLKLLYHPLEKVKNISNEQLEKLCKECPNF